jgi:hypothetical protein
MRNALSHNGGRATPELVAAYGQFLPVASAAALGVREVPAHTPPILGDPIGLDLRGVYGFSDVVLRIIATYDADLSDRAWALSDLASRIGRIEGRARSRVPPDKVTRRIAGLLRGAGLPNADHTPRFLQYLRDTDKIPPYW